MLHIYKQTGTYFQQYNCILGECIIFMCNMMFGGAIAWIPTKQKITFSCYLRRIQSYLLESTKYNYVKTSQMQYYLDTMNEEHKLACSILMNKSACNSTLILYNFSKKICLEVGWRSSSSHPFFSQLFLVIYCHSSRKPFIVLTLLFIISG